MGFRWIDSGRWCRKIWWILRRNTRRCKFWAGWCLWQLCSCKRVVRKKRARFESGKRLFSIHLRQINAICLVSSASIRHNKIWLWWKPITKPWNVFLLVLRVRVNLLLRLICCNAWACLQKRRKFCFAYSHYIFRPDKRKTSTINNWSKVWKKRKDLLGPPVGRI